MVNSKESEPKRNYQQIKQALINCGFDPEIPVSLWEQDGDNWRWTGKTCLAIAICSYEWHQANLGKRFPPQFLYETTAEYAFPPDAKVNELLGLAVVVRHFQQSLP